LEGAKIHNEQRDRIGVSAAPGALPTLRAPFLATYWPRDNQQARAPKPPLAAARVKKALNETHPGLADGVTEGIRVTTALSNSQFGFILGTAAAAAHAAIVSDGA
jgi:hypothetical protein